MVTNAVIVEQRQELNAFRRKSIGFKNEYEIYRDIKSFTRMFSMAFVKKLLVNAHSSWDE